MSQPTVYVVFYAERFSATMEGIFSTREKAETFLAKRVALDGSDDDGLRSTDNYEIREEQVDELEEAFVQHSAIAHWDRPSRELLIDPLGEGELTAKLDEDHHFRYRDGSGAVISHGITSAEAMNAAKASAEKLGLTYFTDPAGHPALQPAE